jgi:hypothetical protein
MLEAEAEAEAACAVGSDWGSTYEERVINLSEDRVLGNNMVDLSKFHNFSFLETLHSKELARLLALREHHASKRACIYIKHG